MLHCLLPTHSAILAVASIDLHDSLEDEVTSCLAKAISAFSRLMKHLGWPQSACRHQSPSVSWCRPQHTTVRQWNVDTSIADKSGHMTSFTCNVYAELFTSGGRMSHLDVRCSNSWTTSLLELDKTKHHQHKPSIMLVYSARDTRTTWMSAWEPATWATRAIKSQLQTEPLGEVVN